jgi:outer membrane protein assembly factor BamE (lipoprotein component of BamABCDE complex)
MNDTVYSKGYSERSFKSLRVGMTIEQVEAAIGPPLHRYSNSSPGFSGYPPGEERWDYSESRSGNSTYYMRIIDFKNRRVSGIHASFFYE